MTPASTLLEPAPTGLSRRDLLRRAAFTAAGAAALGTFGIGAAAPARAAVSATPLWNGHRPGKIYLGMATQGDPGPYLASTGPVGLTREYYSWTSGSGEIRDITREHAAGRMPWVSFKPPFEGAGAWAAVASGRYDAELRDRARRYAALSKPIIMTFNHEPHTHLVNGTPGDFAAAWTRVHDVMDNETGLRNVNSVPILGEWVFNPINKGPNPEEYLTPAVLDRCAFVGVDLYQNRSGQAYDVRLGRVLSFLDARGHSTKMVGVGETGACEGYKVSGAAWWTAAWTWAAQHSDRVGAVSYFNSLAFNRSGNNWLLTASPAKLAAFRASLASPVACQLA